MSRTGETNGIASAVRRIIEGHDLSASEMRDVFGQVMDGGGSDAQKAALLVALRMKGETAGEIVGAAEAMRERVVRIASDVENLVDTCGTGGDGRGTFNVSTVAAFVTAGAGAVVAKHGNRAVSSSCGSADVLAALGVNIDLDGARMSEVLASVGISFLFAPKLHPAMAAVAGIRRELGIRTMFNVLGPLTNPAGARRQVLGVYSLHLLPIVAQALQQLGSVHAMVVHSADGLDEISVSAETHVAELRHGKVTSLVITPEDLGLKRHELDSLAGGDAQKNAAIARDVLNGIDGPERDIVLANAGAAIYVSGLAQSLREGVEAARESIHRGRALEKLEALIKVTNEH